MIVDAVTLITGDTQRVRSAVWLMVNSPEFRVPQIAPALAIHGALDMNDALEHLISRRSFLRQGTCATLGLGGLASQLFHLRVAHAALADRSFSDYKALVCVFLFGGNDNGNTLIPYDGGPIRTMISTPSPAAT